MSLAFIGHVVSRPRTMPICIAPQCYALMGERSVPAMAKRTSSIEAYIPI